MYKGEILGHKISMTNKFYGELRRYLNAENLERKIYNRGPRVWRVAPPGVDLEGDGGGAATFCNHRCEECPLGVPISPSYYCDDQPCVTLLRGVVGEKAYDDYEDFGASYAGFTCDRKDQALRYFKKINNVLDFFKKV